MRALFAALTLLLAAGPAPAASLFDKTWDPLIRGAVATYWTDGITDWLLAKAQLHAESAFNDKVCSKVGACGFAQFMPRSWDDIRRQMGKDPRLVPPTFASAAIESYAFYMRSLRRQWKGWSGVGGMDGHEAAAAGYNAGSGHILKAWRLCGRPKTWNEIAVCLPQVTGHHAKETRGYLVAIRTKHASLKARELTQ